MKRRVLALALAAALLLPGCSAMLNRDYQVVSPHPEYPSVEGDSSAIRAETYQELVNAVLYFVEQGVEHGVVRLVNYTRDVEADLTRACLEVAKDDPLGAYAVDFIKHDCTRVVTTYEANISITYRRTPEQVRALVNVTGSSAIRQELAGALASFAPEVALQVGYFAEDEDSIRALVRQAYYDTPAAALGMPDFTVALYPETGQRRIVEILLTYPEDVEVLRERQSAVLEAARRLSAPFQGPADPAERLDALAQSLRLLAICDPEGGSTVWDALILGRADSEGMALAFQLLCEQCGVACAVLEGQLDGTPHFWNVLSRAGGESLHLDPSGADPTLRGGDGTWLELGYRWQDGAEDPDPSPESAVIQSLPADGGTRSKDEDALPGDSEASSAAEEAPPPEDGQDASEEPPVPPDGSALPEEETPPPSGEDAGDPEPVLDDTR